MIPSTAPASNPVRMRPRALTHVIGWLVLAVVMFAQSPGRVAADTKLDLVADPVGFLARAASAWTDDFTLGQLQNQAYGYFFPQGLFFVLADPLPDWVAQRLWWTVVAGVGFSGFLVLTGRLRVGSPAFRVMAAALYALSPRTLSTLTAISSETWPVMLAPWVLTAFLTARLSWRCVAAALIPVALMGAVNATATLAACLPAGVALAWRLLACPGENSRRGVAGFAAAWLVGCAVVSSWWIGPLLVLGRYAPPFTDFIESSFVTTRWLNLAEMLRGTTSWSPFADSERVAGVMLVAWPVFVLVTMAVAVIGLVGLARTAPAHRVPARGLWITMLAVGIAVLGASHGPFGQAWLEFLDGPGAPLRNVHKFDPLVRLPLLVGLAGMGSALSFPKARAQWLAPGRRHAAAGLVVVVAFAAVAPAWSGRLLPRGTWEEVPEHWVAATDFLNERAAGTRTLITPEASFARQEWGWTRDEPAQPLLEVPWAVRDAIPLVDPEAIRGLDGVMAALHEDPAAGTRALRSLGVGAVLVRHDLDEGVGGELIDAGEIADAADTRVHAFGDGQIEVVLLDDAAGMALTQQDPVAVAGGGESLALLDMLYGPGPRELVASGAEVVTDTPMLVARNYGTLDSPVSAPLATPAEGADVRNRVMDYPSAGPLTRVDEHGGRVAASSSAADATSFGGADPARSVTAAVDGDERTAWWPTPGPAEGEWIQLRGDFPAQASLRITATDDATVVVSTGPLDSDAPQVEVPLAAGEETEVVVPGPATQTIRVTLAGPAPVGVAELAVEDHPVERAVTVPDTSPEVRQFLFQRIVVDTGVIIRDFTVPREMTVEVGLGDGDDEVLIDGTAHPAGAEITLQPGEHRLRTDARWVTLTELGFNPSPAFTDTGTQVPPADSQRLLLTARSANPGLEAELDGVALQPRRVDAGMQAFVIPAGLGGQVTFSFAGDPAYRAALLGGGIAAAAVTVLCAVFLVLTRGRRHAATALVERPGSGWGLLVTMAAALTVAVGWAGLAAVLVAALIRRFTVIPAPLLTGAAGAIAGAWLARAPWPDAAYAGDELALAAVCALAISCLVVEVDDPRAPSARTKRRAGSSMKT